MNLGRIFSGSMNALLGKAPNNRWEQDFDLSPPALPRSFLALAAYIPLGFVVAMAIVKYNDNTVSVPYTAIAITLGLVALTFPLIAYILCMVFDKMDRFRPWVIVRNWTILFALVVIALGYGLFLLGILPFFVAYVILLGVYLSTLAIDIRLAWRIAGFDWIGAVFAGVLISSATVIIVAYTIGQNLG